VPFFSAPLILLFVLLLGCQNISTAQEESAQKEVKIPQPSQKTVQEEGEKEELLTRHSGDEWSQFKIREYLTNNKLVFEAMGSQKFREDQENLCVRIQPDLQNPNFEFIQPNLVTDDWNDPRLDVYKEKYPGKEEYDSFKFAMGYEEKYGSDYIHYPTWNINIYDLDTNADGNVETISYGERLRTQYGRGGGGSFLGYRMYENEGLTNGGGSMTTDPSHFTHDANDYALSGIIRIQNTYAIVIVYDNYQEQRDRRRREHNEHFSLNYSAVVYLLGNQKGFNSNKCTYYFENIQQLQTP